MYLCQFGQNVAKMLFKELYDYDPCDLKKSVQDY